MVVREGESWMHTIWTEGRTIKYIVSSIVGSVRGRQYHRKVCSPSASNKDTVTLGLRILTEVLRASESRKIPHLFAKRSSIGSAWISTGFASSICSEATDRANN